MIFDALDSQGKELHIHNNSEGLQGTNSIQNYLYSKSNILHLQFLINIDLCPL